MISKRIAMYVDGWNMLCSMKRAGIRKYGWCDFRLLAQQQTGCAKEDVTVKFFTSWDTPNPDRSLKKQEIWWKALELGRCDIVRGEFRPTMDEVEEWNRATGKQWREKMTDIKLASHLIADCNLIERVPGSTEEYRWQPGYKEAILLTQDTDFVPAVKIVSEQPFSRRVHVLLPPSDEPAMENASRFWRKELPSRMVIIHQLTQPDFGKALLDRRVHGPNGEVAECHHEWICREDYELQQAIRAKRAAQQLADAKAKLSASPRHVR